MEIPMQMASSRSAALRVLAMLSLGALMAACTSFPSQNGLVGLGLESSPRSVISSGRVTIELRDENGYTMAGYMVDIGWQEPRFYKTRAFTDRNGRVTFSGVPDVAEVTINHEGGIYQQTIIVPQSGRADMAVSLYTQGGYAARLEAERERLRQQQAAASSPAR
jgi:hypothetical protein